MATKTTTGGWPKSTPQVARLLGMTPGALTQALWTGRCRKPAKGPGGAFFWQPRDFESACWSLLHKPMADVLKRAAAR